jgi:hypothetical protein
LFSLSAPSGSQRTHEAERLRRKALESDSLIEIGALIDIAELYDRLYDRLIEAVPQPEQWIQALFLAARRQPAGDAAPTCRSSRPRSGLRK